MSNYYGKRKRGRHSVPNKEEVAEDWCFVCKDGGDLLICDYKQCMKAYHPECAGKAGNVLETGKRWNCEWHYCLICNKSSTYRCFVCTNAVCRKCIKLAEFVQVRGKHGFCNDCLYRALLYEENVDVDSDGRKVDFKDRNTYECLFNEYWEIIKEKEGLTSEDVRSANILLKKGECFRGKMDSDKCFNGEEEDQDFDDVEPCSLMENETKWLPPRKHAKKGKQKRREFMGWGSKSLIEFLKSIGKDSINPITQHDVRDIILKYIGENKLTHPEKKKKVLCDIKLQSIFRRKSINKNKIYDLLERHFKENMEESEKDDYSCNSDEKDEDTIVTCKRQTRTSFRRTKDEKEIVLETPRSCFASVTEHNIKLIYLKRTLIEDFLMTPETFDDKVIGSFVRVKSNPNDCFQKSVYQLLQVTGITKAQGTENITGEVTLQLSNMKEDTPICMLSDDNFLEEEIEELHQRVKNGLLKRLAIVELEQKARRLHEDLTEHWIKKELILLQNLIDQANEKGWRRELYDYFERKDLLQTPSEKQRLLQEIPKVIAEEIEIEVNPLDLPKDENPTKDNSPRAILLTRDSVSADDIAGTDDAIIVDADVKVTLCKEVNGDDTDNRTDESVAEGTEAAITVNAQVTPELSVIELSGDQANKSATESTSGTEDAIIGNADIELMPHISVIEVNVDDSDKRAAEKLAKGVEDAFSVNSNSEVMPDSSMIEVNGGDSDKKAAEKILEGNGAAGYKSSEQEKNGKHLHVNVERNEEAQVILDENEQVDGTLNAGEHLQIQVKAERNEVAQVILDESEHIKETLSTEASHAELIQVNVEKNEEAQVILDENEQVDGTLNARKHRQIQVKVERNEEAQVILDESEHETLSREAYRAELILVNVERNEEAQVILDENEQVDGILNAGKHQQVQVEVERIEEAQVILDESECDEETLRTEASHAELIQVKVECNEEAQVILDENELLDGTLNAGNHQQIQVKVERNEEAQVILDESEHVKETLSTNAGKHHQIQVKVERIEEAQVILDESECDEETLSTEASHAELIQVKVESNEEAQVILDENEQLDGTLNAGNHQQIQVKVERNEETQVILDESEHVKETLSTKASHAEIIDLDDDENPYSKIWHYMNLDQETFGPFMMSQLRKWWDKKFFPTDIQVWKTDQTKEEAIFLKDALRRLFPDYREKEDVLL